MIQVARSEPTYYDPEYGDAVTPISFNLFVRSLPDIDIGLRTIDVDLFDDIDTEKDGFYFTIKDNRVLYSIYQDNVIMLDTYDKEEADKCFIEVYGVEPQIIKYYI